MSEEVAAAATSSSTAVNHAHSGSDAVVTRLRLRQKSCNDAEAETDNNSNSNGVVDTILQQQQADNQPVVVEVEEKAKTPKCKKSGGASGSNKADVAHHHPAPSSALWDWDELNDFFLALMQHGKNFEKIHRFMGSKNKKRFWSRTERTIDDLKMCYRRILSKCRRNLPKEKDFLPKDKEKRECELLVLINYWLLTTVLVEKNQVDRDFHKADWRTLADLIEHGTTTVRTRNKHPNQMVRLRTPVCQALRPLRPAITPANHDAPPPTHINLYLLPHNLMSQIHAQRCYQNPHYRIRAPSLLRIHEIAEFLLQRLQMSKSGVSATEEVTSDITIDLNLPADVTPRRIEYKVDDAASGPTTTSTTFKEWNSIDLHKNLQLTCLDLYSICGGEAANLRLEYSVNNIQAATNSASNLSLKEAFAFLIDLVSRRRAAIPNTTVTGAASVDVANDGIAASSIHPPHHPQPTNADSVQNLHQQNLVRQIQQRQLYKKRSKRLQPKVPQAVYRPPPVGNGATQMGQASLPYHTVRLPPIEQMISAAGNKSTSTCSNSVEDVICNFNTKLNSSLLNSSHCSKFNESLVDINFLAPVPEAGEDTMNCVMRGIENAANEAMAARSVMAPPPVATVSTTTAVSSTVTTSPATTQSSPRKRRIQPERLTSVNGHGQSNGQQHHQQPPLEETINKWSGYYAIEHPDFGFKPLSGSTPKKKPRTEALSPNASSDSLSVSKLFATENASDPFPSVSTAAVFPSSISAFLGENSSSAIF